MDRLLSSHDKQLTSGAVGQLIQL